MRPRNLTPVALLLILLTGCTGAPTQTAAPAAAAAEPVKTRVVGETKVFADTGFKGPDGIAFDSLGHMFVSNRASNVISRVTPDGKVSEFVKIDGAETLCMAVDKENNLYVATRDKLVRVTQDGRVTTVAEGFLGADDLTFDARGNIYMTDAFAAIIYQITPEGEQQVVYDGGLPYRQRTWYFTGISFSRGYDKLYFTNMSDSKVLQLELGAGGKATGEATPLVEGLISPDHMVLDQDGNLLVTSFATRKLYKVTPAGQMTELAKDTFVSPTGLAFGRAGFDEKSVYVADYQGGKIVQVYVGTTAARP